MIDFLIAYYAMGWVIAGLIFAMKDLFDGYRLEDKVAVIVGWGFVLVLVLIAGNVTSLFMLFDRLGALSVITDDKQYLWRKP